MGKPLNLLAFFLGLSLAWVPFSSAGLDDALDGCPIGEQATGLSGGSTSSRQPGYHVDTTNAQSNCYYYQNLAISGKSPLFFTQSCAVPVNGYYGHTVRYNYTFSSCSPHPDYVPSEPAHCSNVVKDGDEIGVNCGGSCSSECVTSCPPGTEYYNTGGDAVGWPASGCVALDGFANAFGACGPGLTRDVLANGTVTCSYYAGTELVASQDHTDLNPPTVPPELIPGSVGGAFSVTEFSYSEIVVDNGDGTETATISKVTTSPGGSSSTSTTSVSRPSGSASGTGLTPDGQIAQGFVGEVTEDVPEEFVIGSTTAPGPLSFGDKFENSLATMRSDFSSYVSDVQNHALLNALSDVLTPSNLPVPPAVVSVSMGGYGTHDIDFAASQSLWDILNSVLLTMALITAMFIIFRKV